MISLLFLMLLSSCSLIPELGELFSPVPEKLPRSLSPNVEESKDPFTLSWKDFYQYPELQTLIASALENNRDLKLAALNVEEVRARYGIQRSHLLPTVDLAGSWTRRRIPENAVFSSGRGATVGQQSEEAFVQEQFALEVGITSYELDFFGRVRSLNESALQEYLASEAARDSVKLTLVSEVAAAYLRLLIDRELEELAQQTAKSQEESVAIIEGRFKSGISSELDLRQAQTLLERSRTDALLASQQLGLDANALSLLVGKSVKAESLNGKFSEVAKAIQKLPVDLRSSALLKRPDIQRSERLLMAANADIGAARAAFFPSISLTGSVGKLSTDVDDLFENDSNSWLFMPQIRLPIFTGGRNKAGLDLVTVRKNRRVVEYEQAIEIAFREVSDALVSNEKLYSALQAQERVVTAAAKAHQLGRLRYESGVENYLVELDALRELYQAQRQHLLGQYQYFSNLSFLFRSIGGGLK